MDKIKTYTLTGKRLFWICFWVWVVGIIIGLSNGIVIGAVKF
jgi:hypothetical protein